MRQSKFMQKTFLLVTAAGLFGCSGGEVTQEDLKRYFSKHKVGSSPDYAIVKNGTDYLVTIHGYMDDQAVCLALIKPLNDDPNLSVVPGAYSCVPLNH